MTARSCTIVGSGVSGLTSGIRLREAGWDAHIVAREPPLDTVSVVAAAVWTTTESEPVARTRPWALRSREVFAELAGDPATGVVPLRQLELERVDPGRSWWEDTPWATRVPPADLPAGYAAGWVVDGFMVEPPIYLRWLAERFGSLGGEIRLGEVDALEDLEGLVVNCSGLGSRRLVGDTGLHPIRGQVVAVDNPGITDAIADESDLARIAYIYPRSREVILGGVRESGRTEPAPDEATTQRILGDCAALDPRIAARPVVGVRVGLRPGRHEVRVDQEVSPSGAPVIHNYGHGGSGYILSWGCAEEVVALAGNPR